MYHEETKQNMFESGSNMTPMQYQSSHAMKPARKISKNQGNFQTKSKNVKHRTINPAMFYKDVQIPLEIFEINENTKYSNDVPDRIVRLAMEACAEGERIGLRNKRTFCFKNMQHICTKTIDHIKQPELAVASVQSHGIPWIIKNYVFAFLRMLDGWKCLELLLLEKHEVYDRIEDKYYSPHIRDTFYEWQVRSKYLLSEVLQTLEGFNKDFYSGKTTEEQNIGSGCTKSNQNHKKTAKKMQNCLKINPKNHDDTISRKMMHFSNEYRHDTFFNINNNMQLVNKYNSVDAFNNYSQLWQNQTYNIRNETLDWCSKNDMLGMKQYSLWNNAEKICVSDNNVAIQTVNDDYSNNDKVKNELLSVVDYSWEAAKQAASNFISDINRTNNQQKIFPKYSNSKKYHEHAKKRSNNNYIKKIGNNLISILDKELLFKIKSYKTDQLVKDLKNIIEDTKWKINNNQYPNVRYVIKYIETIFLYIEECLKIKRNDEIEAITQQCYKHFQMMIIQETYMNNNKKNT